MTISLGAAVIVKLSLNTVRCFILNTEFFTFGGVRNHSEMHQIWNLAFLTLLFVGFVNAYELSEANWVSLTHVAQGKHQA